ncbi:hypothetical protein Ddc_14591 [Ditylenchus destructor]|nr:hypothetical protein Ddc_14591 [Ditylenchus destructor]
MAAQFVCSQCPTESMHLLSELGIKPHISSEHLDYFPFGCATCKKANQKHLAATKEDMEQHISTCHNGNNLGILLLEDKDKEVELNKMIEQCRRWPPQQFPSNDSKRELRRALHMSDTGTDGGDDDVIVLGDENETASITTNNSSFGNLPEQATQMEPNEPYEQSVARPITENAGGPNAVLPKTEPSVTISIVPEPLNFTEPYVEMELPRHSTSNRKRRLLDNASNDLTESRENGRLVMNDEHLESGGHCSRDVNHGNANGSSQSVKPVLRNATMSQRKDSFERPTTSSQVASSIPVDSSQKQIITKLFIVVSEGIVCFETIGSHTYDYAPLRDHLPILAGSELCKNGCEVVIQFNACEAAIPFKYRKTSEQPKQEFASLEQLKTFARQLYSIAFLWANVTVVAHFGPFKKKRSKMPSQLDYCSELFSRERSILKCKKLDIVLFDNWPLSIVTNVVDRCEECDLQLEEIIFGNCEVHDAFLEEFYEREVLHKVDVTLCIPDFDAVNDFMDKLKERFRSAPQKCFKVELFTHSKEVRKLSVKKLNYILKAKTSNNHQESVIIEQRAIGS